MEIVMIELNIIILEDDIVQNTWYKAFYNNLSFPPCRVTTTENLALFKTEFRENFYNFAIIDYYLPDTNGREVLEYIKANNPSCEVIIVSSTEEISTVVDLMKTGAFDFLKKPLDPKRLQALTMQVWESQTIVKERNINRPAPDRRGFSQEIIYKSQKIEKILDTATRCAGVDSTVLIRGESGTGKELIANSIYSMSRRTKAPFVVLNIASLPETLVESELFGHKKGAFTGASNDRIGRFEEADGGTLFIDEIGDISMAVQVKLLRAIQFKTFQKLGDNDTYKSDVRIIAATSRNLEEMIKTREFREDLYYRLSVITIRIPPLRERKEDIKPLVEYFLENKCRFYGKSIPRLTDKVTHALIRHDYPGNVRELENVVEHAVVMNRAEILLSEDLPEQLRIYVSDDQEAVGDDSGTEEDSSDDFLSIDDDDDLDLEKHLMNMEKKIISRALEKCEGNQSAAARVLKISERKMRFRMEKLNLENVYRTVR
ncbi:sigma-54-dependent transcriptional regulator [Spirochaeta isovalerica]|uniref:DNA-binding NtrC family response regulator n=1 Tax=Spirochaeta isovalerica TaxID=150 RepID=A0A841RBW4_9SPIO|nr:sigma-54 dependent transcriptional regulator [Spirochaeta isovalerica]MBB6480500.1 DNA-binding NtrC family response regulator [Spirochaeta isovalerica]